MDFQPKPQRRRASLQLAESGMTGDIVQSDDVYIPKKITKSYGTEIKRAGGDELESQAQLALWMVVGLRKSHSLRVCAIGDYEDGR